MKQMCRVPACHGGYRPLEDEEEQIFSSLQEGKNWMLRLKTVLLLGRRAEEDLLEM